MQIVSICMKFQILFSRKNKKNINLSSAELAQRVVMVKWGFHLKCWKDLNAIKDSHANAVLQILLRDK